MKTNDEKYLLKELDTNDNFSELLELSKEFFYEYENNNQEFFKIDIIDLFDNHIKPLDFQSL
jgi:hypothetical protein